MKCATVLIADDDAGFRRVVRRLLEKEDGVALVGEAGDGEEAVRLNLQLRPEVVFMDIAMPKLDGLEATRRIKASRPETKVVVISIHNEEVYRKAATECGADDYVLKKRFVDGLRSAFGARRGRAGNR